MLTHKHELIEFVMQFSNMMLQTPLVSHTACTCSKVLGASWSVTLKRLRCWQIPRKAQERASSLCWRGGSLTTLPVASETASIAITVPWSLPWCLCFVLPGSGHETIAPYVQLAIFLFFLYVLFEDFGK